MLRVGRFEPRDARGEGTVWHVSFKLDRLYALSVSPQRGTDETLRIAPSGGAVAVDADAEALFGTALNRVSQRQLATVVLDVDTTTRINRAREHVMQVAFGATQAPAAGARKLAATLSGEMDQRSSNGLLLVSVEKDMEHSDRRRVHLILLPEETVVRMRGNQGEHDVSLDVIRDAFSTASSLRKIARFTGHNSQTQFLTADVLDLQLMGIGRAAADFWVTDFLQAHANMNSATGTEKLALALKRSFDAATSLEDKEAVLAAILKATSGGTPVTSLSNFTHELPPALADAFLVAADNDEVANATFAVDPGILRAKIGRRVVFGEGGVVVSAPAEEFGKSVTIEPQKGGIKNITYRGQIQSQAIVKERGRR